MSGNSASAGHCFTGHPGCCVDKKIWGHTANCSTNVSSSRAACRSGDGGAEAAHPRTHLEAACNLRLTGATRRRFQNGSCKILKEQEASRVVQGLSMRVTLKLNKFCDLSVPPFRSVIFNPVRIVSDSGSMCVEAYCIT